jgi:hypothetical protein
MDIANHIALVEDLAMASKALELAVNKLEAGYGHDSELVDVLDDIDTEITDFVVLMHEVLAKEHPEEPNHYKDLYYKIITVDE